MSRKKIIVSFGLVAAVGGLLFFSFRQRVTFPQNVNTLTSQYVQLRIDFGNGNARDFSDIHLVTGATAFSILKEETARVGLALYSSEASSIGVFVRQIDDKKNGDGGRYWQYWVNGQFAMVAADRYILRGGDVVQWKFVGEMR